MISLGRSKIEALIDLAGGAPAIEAALIATSKDRVKMPQVGHITFPEAAVDCPLVRS